MRYILLIISLTLSFYVSAQTYSLFEKQELQASQFWGVDSFGASYHTQHSVVHKTADQTYTYTNKAFGIPDFIDLSNPMRILVFYKAAQQALILDNKLNPIQVIDFNSFDTIGFVTHVGTSSGQGLWFFDESQHEVYLYYPNNKDLISQLHTQIRSKLINFIGAYNHAFVQTEDEIQLYAHNGSFIHSHKLEADLYLASKGILLHSDNDLYYWQSNTSELQKLDFEISGKNIKNLFYIQEKLYLFDGKFLHTYIAQN